MLKRINVLRSAPATAVDALVARRSDRRLRAHEMVFHPPDVGDAVYLVESGRIRLSSFDAAGREIVLAILDAGEFFGEEPRPAGELRRASAVALEDSRVWRLARADFEEVLADHPSLAHSVAYDLSARLLETPAELPTDASPRRRLVRWLLLLSEQRGVYEEGGRIRLDLSLSAVELAWMTQVGREEVLRILRDLEVGAWLELRSGSIVLTDLPSLRHELGEAP